MKMDKKVKFEGTPFAQPKPIVMDELERLKAENETYRLAMKASFRMALDCKEQVGSYAQIRHVITLLERTALELRELIGEA
jgi:hypothetical protein